MTLPACAHCGWGGVGTGSSAARFWLVAVLGLGAVAIHAAVMLFRPFDQATMVALVDLALLAASLAASAAALATSRVQRVARARWSWRLIGLGLLSYSAGTAGWTWIEVVRHQTAASPDWPDIGYLAAIPLVLTGIVTRPIYRPPEISRRLLTVDVGIALCSLATISWVLVLGPLVERTQAGPLALLTVLAYPIGDLWMLFCLLSLVLREAELRPSALFLLLGIGMYALADSAFLILDTYGAYARGHPLDVLWFAGMVAVVVAAALERDAPAEVKSAAPPTVSPIWRYMLPGALISLAAALVIAVPAIREGRGMDPSHVLLIGGSLLLLVQHFHLHRAAARAYAFEQAQRLLADRALDEERERRRQLEVIRDVTQEISRELEMTSVLQLIARRAAELVGANHGAISLWDEACGRLVPRAWHGFDGWTGPDSLALGEGVVGQVALRRSGMAVNDYQRSPYALPGQATLGAIDAIMAEPILCQDQLIGVLLVVHSGGEHRFSEHDQALLRLFAASAAIAIENARLLEQAASAEALRELARLKADFLNTVSHELRTPLSLIFGYSELLMHRAPRLSAQRIADMAAEIHLGSQTMARLVDDLLDASRLEQGRLALRRCRASISRVLRDRAAAIRREPGGERLVVEIEDGLEGLVDPDRLGQVATALLHNALRYAPAGPVRLEARRAGASARVVVADQGPGISREEQSRIWEPFYRGSTAQNSPHRGSGLGLAIAQHLIVLHGGQIGVESAPGHGATFWFEVPLAGGLDPGGRTGKGDAPHADLTER